MRCKTTNKSGAGGAPLDPSTRSDFWLHVCRKCGHSDIHFDEGPPESCPKCQSQEWYLYLNPKDNDVLGTPDLLVVNGEELTNG